jgi:hypothetical protein
MALSSKKISGNICGNHVIIPASLNFKISPVVSRLLAQSLKSRSASTENSHTIGSFIIQSDNKPAS